ncbi:MAG: mandelate racemase/muconate lactonizing enzyme family protein [Pseudomonadota bacterium]
MKITRISVYQKELTYVGGEYTWGRGNVIDVARSSVVTLETDTGHIGVGEFCPCGENYMNAHSFGVAAAAQLLAPKLLGADPRQVSRIGQLMDNTVGGHIYAKSPFDAACWDLLGKDCGQPVWMLMGGKLTDGAPMYRVAPQKALAETLVEMQAHRKAGYRQFQIKVGGDATTDIERIRSTIGILQPDEKAYADANQGWTINEAIKVVRAVRDLDVMIEQPCPTYEECLHVRAHTDLSMKLDECVTDLRMARRIVHDKAADVVCLKISNLGGLTKARLVRDFLVTHGLSVVAEDTWGGEITTAAVAHLAASTTPQYLYNTTDLHNYNVERTGIAGPPTQDGKLYVSDAPGLGVEADFDALGDPVSVFA